MDNRLNRIRKEMNTLRVEMLRAVGVEGSMLGVGVDRIDYTKGIPERLRALDRLLEKYPTWREHLVFVQIGVPSRTHVKAYQMLDDEIDGLVEEINWRWSTDSWKPIVYLKQQLSPIQMMALHRLAQFCIVNALDDDCWCLEAQPVKISVQVLFLETAGKLDDADDLTFASPARRLVRSCNLQRGQGNGRG